MYMVWQISNILSVTDPIIGLNSRVPNPCRPHFFGPNVFGPNLFLNTNFLDQQCFWVNFFFTLNIFGLKIFWLNKIWGPKNIGSWKNVWLQIFFSTFWVNKKYKHKISLESKTIFVQKNGVQKNFFGSSKNFWGPQKILVQKICLV